MFYGHAKPYFVFPAETQSFARGNRPYTPAIQTQVSAWLNCAPDACESQNKP